MGQEIDMCVCGWSVCVSCERHLDRPWPLADLKRSINPCNRESCWNWPRDAWLICVCGWSVCTFVSCSRMTELKWSINPCNRESCLNWPRETWLMCVCVFLCFSVCVFVWEAFGNRMTELERASIPATGRAVYNDQERAVCVDVLTSMFLCFCSFMADMFCVPRYIASRGYLWMIDLFMLVPLYKKNKASMLCDPRYVASKIYL